MLTLKTTLQTIFKRRQRIGTIAKQESQRNVTEYATSNTILPQPSTPPVAIPITDIITSLPSLFPRSLHDSRRDYNTFTTDIDSLQLNLLKTLPFFPMGSSQKVAKLIRTPIDDEGNYINEFCIMPAVKDGDYSSPDLKHLIFIHGYGAGLGFFLKNLENIPLLDNKWCIHAIDLPGYGFSSRFKFPFHYPNDSQTKVQKWFHDRIYRWFRERNLLQNPQNNLVMAHSLGAYLMAHYAFHFSNHFKKIIMCSPAGVSQFAVGKQNKQPPWWYNKLWDLNYSPFSLVRNSGIYGSKITSGWSYRRFKPTSFNGLNESQFEALHKYTYGIFNKNGSGEYLLSFILSCGGDPRFALEDNLFKEENPPEDLCDWVWVYGDRDWMDINGAHRISRRLVKKAGDTSKSKVHVIPSAGHHLYLDNYKAFNNLIIKEMETMG